MQDRVAVTFHLPPRLAHAIIDAAKAANRLNDDGSIVQDHMIFAGAKDIVLNVFKSGVLAPSKHPSKPSGKRTRTHTFKLSDLP